MGQVQSKESYGFIESVRLSPALGSDVEPIAENPASTNKIEWQLSRKTRLFGVRINTPGHLSSIERFSKALNLLVNGSRLNIDIANRTMAIYSRLYATVNDSETHALRLSRVAFDLLRGGSVNLCAVETLQQIESRMTLSMRCVPDVVGEETEMKQQSYTSKLEKEIARWNADRKIYFYRTNFVLHPLTETLLNSFAQNEQLAGDNDSQLDSYRLTYLLILEPAASGGAGLSIEHCAFNKLIACSFYAMPSSPMGLLIPVLSDLALKDLCEKYPNNNCCARLVIDRSSSRTFIGLPRILKLTILVRLAIVLDYLHKRIKMCFQMGYKIPYDFVTCASLILQYVKACCIGFHLFTHNIESESSSTFFGSSGLDDEINKIVEEEIRDIGQNLCLTLSLLLKRNVGWSSELFLTGICTLCTDWAHLMPPEWVDNLRSISETMTICNVISEPFEDSECSIDEQQGSRLVAADLNWWRPSCESNIASRILWLTALCAAQMEVLQRGQNVMREEYHYLSRHMPYIAYIIILGQLRRLLEMALQRDAEGDPKLLDQWLVLFDQVLSIILRMTKRGLKSRRFRVHSEMSVWWNGLGWNDRFSMELPYSTKWSGFEMVDNDKINFIPRANLISTLRFLGNTVITARRLQSNTMRTDFLDKLSYYDRVFNGELTIERQVSLPLSSDDSKDETENENRMNPQILNIISKQSTTKYHSHLLNDLISYLSPSYHRSRPQRLCPKIVFNKYDQSDPIPIISREQIASTDSDNKLEYVFNRPVGTSLEGSSGSDNDIERVQCDKLSEVSELSEKEGHQEEVSSYVELVEEQNPQS